MSVLPVFFTANTAAEEVKLRQGELILNGNLEKSTNWPAGITLLITHGTLSHKDSEIIRTLQELFLEEQASSLAVNLSLGQSNRQGSYDCSRRHTHRHTDAIGELQTWLLWLQERGVDKIVPLGHSRGANQTAWFTSESPSSSIIAQILVAPPAPGSRTDNEADGQPHHDEALARARTLVASGHGDTVLEPARFLYCDEPAVTAASLLSYANEESRMDTRTLLRDTPLPTLVVVGSEDKTTPGLAEAYKRLSGRTQVTLLIIDGADHFFRDLYADELVEGATEFLLELMDE